MTHVKTRIISCSFSFSILLFSYRLSEEKKHHKMTSLSLSLLKSPEWGLGTCHKIHFLIILFFNLVTKIWCLSFYLFFLCTCFPPLKFGLSIITLCSQGHVFLAFCEWLNKICRALLTFCRRCLLNMYFSSRIWWLSRLFFLVELLFGFYFYLIFLCSFDLRLLWDLGNGGCWSRETRRGWFAPNVPCLQSQLLHINALLPFIWMFIEVLVVDSLNWFRFWILQEKKEGSSQLVYLQPKTTWLISVH